ncbi:TMEM175 family protein [Weissella koreensis]|uniref:TMEM175 family protein n=1 Tax=Weissella koreensis TaxID=165096 RepID=UPI0022BA6AD6|nr:TMEM175 family protein [Weissella koreensis]MCZ9311549.1 TMEM175 family protein [Weissella koreensis]
MNKNRVEAFTDAIIAIIATIMVLEFKTPETYQLSGIIEELPYLFSYATSFFFILVAWYNHHYMFSITQRITKKVYWVNNFWLFSMSLIPVSTAWVGRYINHTVPELFYFFIFLVWTIAYLWLSRSIAMSLDLTDKDKADKIRNMPAYKSLENKYLILALILAVFLSFVFPPIMIITTLIELIIMSISTPEDADKIFQ